MVGAEHPVRADCARRLEPPQDIGVEQPCDVNDVFCEVDVNDLFGDVQVEPGRERRIVASMGSNRARTARSVDSSVVAPIPKSMYPPGIRPSAPGPGRLIAPPSSTDVSVSLVS